MLENSFCIVGRSESKVNTSEDCLLVYFSQGEKSLELPFPDLSYLQQAQEVVFKINTTTTLPQAMVHHVQGRSGVDNCQQTRETATGNPVLLYHADTARKGQKTQVALPFQCHSPLVTAFLILPPTAASAHAAERAARAETVPLSRLWPATTQRAASATAPTCGAQPLHSAPWAGRPPRSSSSAARQRALLGGAVCDGPSRKRGGCRRWCGRWRRWRWRSSSIRGAPSKMTSIMAATWPRPAFTSAWVGTGDKIDTPSPPLTAHASPCGEAPLPPSLGRASALPQLLSVSPAACGVYLRSGSALYFNHLS